MPNDKPTDEIRPMNVQVKQGSPAETLMLRPINRGKLCAPILLRDQFAHPS